MSIPCERCVQGHVIEGTPAGTLEDAAYFHPGSSDSKIAVVLLTDIFGLKLVNPKLIADQYSQRLKCDVWVPDYFNGKPPVDEAQLAPMLHDVPGTKYTFLQKLRLFLVILQALPGFIMNRSSVVDERTIAFLKHIKTEKQYEKIGVIGFCYGGSIICRLGSKDLFDSAVIAHPGPTSTVDLEAMKVPTSWICAEEDPSFTPKLRARAESIFQRKNEITKLDYEFRDYKGTVHGFGSRPDLGNPVIKKAFEQSMDQGVGWFQKTLGL